MIEILDPTDSRLLPFTTLKTLPNETFVAENPKVITALLKSDLEIDSFLALPHYYDQFSSLLSSKKIKNLYTSKKEILDKLIGYRLHHGILALAKIPPSLSLSQLNSPLITFDRLANSENVGSIIRSAHAFGFNNLIIDPLSSPPYQRRAVRASMGAMFSMNIHYSKNLISTLQELKQKEILIIGAEMTPQSVPLPAFTPKKPHLLIFGSEGTGLSQNVLNLCDEVVSIPLKQELSLNVGSAAAVFFYHLCKH